MTLRPEIKKYLDEGAAANPPQAWEIPIASSRKLRMGRVAVAGTPEAIYQVEHKFIAGPTSDLPIRIYRPSAQGPLPAMVYFHGGGWVFNTLDMFEQCLRSIANKGNFIIVAVAYQKAPEHPFPIPFDDCYATTKWVFENAQALGIDPKKIGVSGDSAGANLASAVALKVRDEGDLALAFQALIYPCNDFEMKYESATENGTGFGLTTKGMRWFWEEYLQSELDKHHPYAVPITAESLKDLPPTIVVTAEYDPLLDDGYNYAEALKDAGVFTIYREYAGLIHGFMIMASVTPEAVIAQHNLADEINALLNG